MPDQRKEALQRLESASPEAAVAGAMASAKLRLIAWCVPHAFPAAFVEADLVLQVTDARTRIAITNVENAARANAAFSGH